LKNWHDFRLKNSIVRKMTKNRQKIKIKRPSMMNISGITSSSINLINQPPLFEFPTSGLGLGNNPFNSKFINRGCNNTSNEAEQLASQLDQLFGYRKGLNAKQEKQVDDLFDQIDDILQSNANAGPSKAQQSQLDKLFDEVDEIYQARSYESLTSQEQVIVDRLLEQLDVTLA